MHLVYKANTTLNRNIKRFYHLCTAFSLRILTVQNLQLLLSRSRRNECLQYLIFAVSKLFSKKVYIYDPATNVETILRRRKKMLINIHKSNAHWC